MADPTTADATRADAPAPRIGSIDGRHAGTPLAAALPAAPAMRVNLRAGADAVPALEAALGLSLSGAIGTSDTDRLRSALRLGPDEWLLIEEDAGGKTGGGAGKESGVDGGAGAFRAPLPTDLAGVGAIHSAVDVSHRNAAILVTGPRAAEALEHGCPRDLSLEAFPPGACARTLIGKCEVVLWRGKPDAFRIEVWRSFAPYAMDFLAEACRDASL